MSWPTMESENGVQSRGTMEITARGHPLRGRPVELLEVTRGRARVWSGDLKKTMIFDLRSLRALRNPPPAT